MAKVQRKLKKNIKKTSEQQKKEYPQKNQIMSFAKTIYGIIIAAILIYGITVIVNKTYVLKDESKYDMTQILAGQTFSKLDEEYYVVFYNFNEQKDITTNIESVTDKAIYKVDLSLGNNKYVISDTGNNTAMNANDLKINGPTIIKISNGSNIEYVEGLDSVNNYLKQL